MKTEIKTSELAAIMERSFRDHLTRCAGEVPEGGEPMRFDLYLLILGGAIAYGSAAGRILSETSPDAHAVIDGLAHKLIMQFQKAAQEADEKDDGEDVPGFLGHMGGGEA